MIFQNCFQSFHHLLAIHLSIFYQHIDPLAQPVSCDSRTQKRHYLFAILWNLVTILYGTFGLQYEANLPLDLPSLAVSPYIFTHQIMHHLVWSNVDFSLILDYTLAFAILITCLTMSPIGEHHRMTLLPSERLSCGRVVFSKEESKCCLMLQKRWKISAAIGVSFTCAVLIGVSYTFVFFVNAIPKWSFFTWLYWCLLFPLSVVYLSFAVFGYLLYTILVIIIFRIKLKSILRQLTLLKSSKPAQYQHFLRINHQHTALCFTLTAYSHHLLPILSCLFPFFTILQCYLINSVLFTSIPFILKLTFLLLFASINISVLLLTKQCSAVVKGNSRITMANGRFYLHCLQSKAELPNLLHLLKMEHLLHPYRLQKFAFKLIGSYRITSKSFYLIIDYSTIITMFIIKVQLRQQSSDLLYRT